MYNLSIINQKLAEGKMVLGSHVGFDSPFLTEALAGCGFDFIWIDAEHSALDKKEIQNHLMACRAAGAAGIVRVPWNDPVYIKCILDMGADGIIVPMIRSLEEARQAVGATHYPPVGERGMGVRRAVNYGLWDKGDYVANSDQYIWTILQIEHVDVIKDLEAICRMDGVSGFVIGPNDFLMSMHTPERIYKAGDPEVEERLEQVCDILRASGKTFGVSGVYSEEFVRCWTARGASFLCMNFDFHYIVSGGTTVLRETRRIFDGLQVSH